MTARNDPARAHFEICVEGVTRSHRDGRAIALDAAKTLKEKTPGLSVSVRDMRDSAVTVIGWESGKAVVK